MDSIAPAITWRQRLFEVCQLGIRDRLDTRVMTLTAVISVMNGFDHELKQRLLGSVPHVTLINGQDDSVLRRFAADARVRQVAPYFESFGVLNHARRVQPIMVLGLDKAGFEAQPGKCLKRYQKAPKGD